MPDFEMSGFDAVTRAKELGIDVEQHRCTCEPCLHSSALCTASLSSLLMAIEEAERPYVCPGCHAVAPERCLPGCIDDEIEREREDALMRGDYDREESDDVE